MWWIYASWILGIFTGLLGDLVADPSGCSILQQSVCKEKCIPVSWLCNGEKDCPDGTDEQCDLPCRGDISAWQCDNGKCISKNWKCDGVSDCLDGSDEVDCGCPDNKIQCANSDECIHEWEVCDGYNDCENGSEEQNCSMQSCMENQVQCKNKVCIMESWRCDGINSCGDGSDEESCERCTDGFYQCGDGKCINDSKVCNRKMDCLDGSDESDLCGRKCSDKNGGCSQICTDAPWGVICSCPEGWELKQDRRGCADLDECSADYSPCHQLCNNAKGFFTCGCVKGFSLKEGTVCEVIDNATVLLLAKKDEIGVMDVRGGDYLHLFSVRGQPIAVAYYLSSESYFWINENKTLQSFVIGRKNSTSLYPDVMNMNSLSVDWLTGQLFWASSINKIISAGLMDGRGYVHVIEKGIVPDQLVVFPQKRYMYWVNYGTKGNTTLQMAGMDGSDRHVISFIPMEQPTGLTIDYIASRLYWISEYKESIETIKTDGSGRFTFPNVLHKDQNVLGLSVFEGWFFLTDESRLFSLLRNNPRERRLLMNTSNVSAFTVLHELQQPNEEPSPCSLRTCSHICLLSPVLAKSYKCACPAGLFLLPSGKCENLKLVYGDGGGIYLLELGFQGVLMKRAIIWKTPRIYLMTVDWKRDLVYWTDEHGLLLRSNGLDENPRVIHTSGAVCVVTIDIATGNMYWLPCERNKVFLTKHSGSGTKMIYQSNKSIQNLLINWEKTLLYVVEDGNLIRQMNLSGGEVENVLNGTGFTQMSLDIKSHSIVWTSPDHSLYSFSLLKDRLFHLKENFTSALLDSFEPYLISYKNPAVEIWDRKTMRIVSTINEANVTRLVIASSYVKDGQSACSVDNGGCMSEEICVPGFKDSKHCICPDDKFRCSEGENALKEKPSSETLSCPRAFLPCRDGTECVAAEFICDGEDDCLDGSDEQNCTQFCNKAGIFQCLTGNKCIEDRYHCDGVRQCPDGSDEENCWSPVEICAMRCDGNRCMPQSAICDGNPDCIDETDEQVCVPKECSRGKFQCTNGQCVPYSMHCDGDNDCDDHSDEINCMISKPVYCQNGDFRCQSGECILKEWRCDDTKDCKDGSDEKDCKLEKVSCEKHQWSCVDEDQCIPSFWKCDGMKDCKDGSDEVGCEPKKCESHMYQCKNFGCVSIAVVCDGKLDCSDGSDEGGKCNVPCEGGCSHVCQISPFGPKCMCFKGFKLIGNGSCVDINECKDFDPFPCSQACINLNGTFNCTCHPGYVLQRDSRQCKVTGTEPVLLVAVQFDLLIYKLRTFDEEVLVSTDKSSMIFSVDYDIKEQKVFWMDLNAESVKWLTIGTKAKGTLVKGIKSDCIAVDWVGRNLYWTDGIAGQILATALDASWKGFPEYTVVLDEGVDQPRSLVLQPLSGLMYWCEIGTKTQIESAGMDGSHRRVLISEQLGWPTGLALDLLRWRIYWCDDKFHSIGSATLDGTDIKVIQLKTIQSPFALAVFEDEIYWSEIKARTVQKISKNTGKDLSVLIKRHGQPYGLKVMHEVLQPEIESPCKSLNCSHMCLIGPGLKASCWCPTGLVLSSNLFACVLPKDLPFLLIASPSSVNQVDLQKLILLDDRAPPKHKFAALANVDQISSIDYIIQDRSLVFAVRHGGYIGITKVKDSDSKDWKKVVFVEDSVTCIAVDWVTGNIFWIGTAKAAIQVATSNGMYKAVVNEDLYKPSSLVLNPVLGLMCFFDSGLENKKNSLKIECASMDGSNRRVVWKKSRAVVGLTFVDSGSRLYWADEGFGTIESIMAEGTNYQVVRSGLNGVNVFTAGGGLLLWATSDDATGRIWFSKIGTSENNKYFDTNQKVIDLKVYSRPAQHAANNGCSQNNGGCSQICLPNLENRTCRCSPTYQLVNATKCLEEPNCHKGYQLCKDGLKCVPNGKICDNQMDCLDGSDERGCMYSSDKGLKSVTSPAKPKMSTKGMVYPKLQKATVKTLKTKAPTPRSQTFSDYFEGVDDNGLENEEFGRNMESRPCNTDTCNGRGECIVDAGVIKCSCFPDYSGDFCENGVKSIAVPLTVGTVAILFAFALGAGIFVFVTQRRALRRTSSSASSRTLTRHSAKDMEPLDVHNKETSEVFLNDAFDDGGTTNEQDHI